MINLLTLLSHIQTEDAASNSIDSIVEESKYCGNMMKKKKTKKNKDFEMTKKDVADFKNSTTCWICTQRL